MKIKVTTEVEAPDGATHYFGDLLDNPTFVKMTMVGVVGEHWWSYNQNRKEWVLISHHRPHWLKEINQREESAEQAFTEWLVGEMPPGTVISNPEWWAKRIHSRFFARTSCSNG